MESQPDNNNDDSNLVPLNLSRRKLVRIHCLHAQQRKLVVLDLDNTLCDFGANALNNNNSTIPRPYLHEFLKTIYKYYDITLWSAQPYEDILMKMKTLNILDNEYFKINFILTRDHMKSMFMKCCNKHRLVKFLLFYIFLNLNFAFSCMNFIFFMSFRITKFICAMVLYSFSKHLCCMV